MKRSELEALGLTPEQIDKVMAENGKDIQSEKAKAETYKANSEKADELQKQLDAINEKNLTEVEKATKELEKANSRIAELEKAQKISELKSSLAEKFKISTEQVTTLVKEDGSLDYDFLSQIISEKEIASANAKELEIAKGTMNPGSTGTGESKKTEAEVYAETHGKAYATVNTNSKSIVDSYL